MEEEPEHTKLNIAFGIINIVFKFIYIVKFTKFVIIFLIDKESPYIY